jgi:hypothetical protein
MWKVEGWAHDVDYPELPVLLEVLLGDRVIGTVLACDYRWDLAKAGLGQGRSGFSFSSPTRIRPEALDTLIVRRAADRAEILMTDDCRAKMNSN